jgi:hypothetical protein
LCHSAGYKLNKSGLICDLTLDQQLFVAFCQNEYFRTLLSPYIDTSPTSEQIDAERRKMARLDKYYRENPPETHDFFGLDKIEWKD